jgi:hypothetical protein
MLADRGRVANLHAQVFLYLARFHHADTNHKHTNAKMRHCHADLPTPQPPDLAPHMLQQIPATTNHQPGTGSHAETAANATRILQQPQQ